MVHIILLGGVIMGLLWGNIGKITLGGFVSGHVFEPLLLIHIIVLLVTLQKTYLHRALYEYRWLLVFACMALLSIIPLSRSFSLMQNSITLLYALRLFAYIAYGVLLYAYLLQIHTNHPKIYAQTVPKIVSIGIAAVTIIALLQYFTAPDLTQLPVEGFDPHKNRIFGAMLDTSAESALIGIAAILLITIHPFLFAPTLMLLLQLFTYSRGGFLAQMVSLLVFSVYRKSTLFLLALFLLMQIIISHKPKAPDQQGTSITRVGSVYSRTDDYKQGIVLYLQHPMLGWGYNRIGFIKHQPGMQGVRNNASFSFHSSFLIIAVTMGMFGLAVFLMALLQIAMRNIPSFALVAFLSVFSLFDNILLYPHILVLWLISASLLKLYKQY